MDEEDITLPTLSRHHTQHSDDLQLPQNTSTLSNLQSRKRSTRYYELQQLEDDAISSSIHTSSDPALFSSDETPDAENYSGNKRRKKKTYTGTWWGERFRSAGSRSRRASSSASSRKVKRKFTRNFDSGIFMNSDEGSTDLSSDSSFGAELFEEQRRVDDANQYDTPHTPVQQKSKLSLSFGSPCSQGPRSAKKPILVDAREQHVMSVVRKCLEDSKEDIDLTGMDLDQLPVGVNELNTMIKDDPASSLQFDSLVARPRVYLSNNSFRVFPAPILELSNLRLLSLRQNKLTKLPPGIRNLIRLETLNISGNRLEHMPIEVLDLMSEHRLVEIQSEPNPWITCTEDQKTTDREKTRLSNRPRVFITRPHEDKQAFHTLLSLTATSRGQQQKQQRLGPNTTSRGNNVPSLSEMVLRQLSRANHSKRDLTSLMPDGTSARVVELLDDLHTAQTEGDRHCARCKRVYITPAETWIEWWDVKSRGENHDLDSVMRTRVMTRTMNGKAGLVLPFEVGICEACV